MIKFLSQETLLTLDDVLIVPKFSNVASRFSDDMNPYVFGKLPIVSAPMDTILSEEFINLTKDRVFALFSHRFQTLDEQILHLKAGANGAVIGLKDTEQDIIKLIKSGAKHILLDVANGGNIEVVKKLESLQHHRGKIELWAGNIATAECYRQIVWLCDFVRCGIGSGSACDTRTNSGVGYPLLSTILDCREVFDTVSHVFPDKTPAKIVADGGLKTNGDICKSIAAGAHLCMLGKIFASTTESCAEFYNDEKKYKMYRGMASLAVNKEANKQKFSVEGASGLIKHTGSVVYTLDQIDANLRSSMSYVGAKTLFEYYHKTQFVKISAASHQEGKSQLS